MSAAAREFTAGQRVRVRGRTERAGNAGSVVSKLPREAHHITDRYLVLLDADKARAATTNTTAQPRQFHESAMREEKAA